MRTWLLVIVTVLAGCTPGAPPAGAGGSTTASAASVTIDVSLTASTVIATAYGTSGGFMPGVASVPVGATVRFVNVDSFGHTSTSLSGASFPAASPFDASAQLTSGTTLSGGWSSGTLGAGNGSQVLLADKPGTYLYGCFFHYTAPMRGAIVVQ
ncbi:MAG TPA: plastocyanin/azurin family copper-binding protein [Candidatus Elarobacter sp.]|nr:plastocyanin/azurin family copper-binding protein [Candidatus Elarobacter sp.]